MLVDFVASRTMLAGELFTLFFTIGNIFSIHPSILQYALRLYGRLGNTVDAERPSKNSSFGSVDATHAEGPSETRLLVVPPL
jgi:hypothetical protein